MKYTLRQIADICGGKMVGGGSAEMSVDSLLTDSRNSISDSGSLFVAIRGFNHDGHAYINELYARGVRAFVIERDIATGKYPDAVFIRVDSSVAALQAVAADYRKAFTGTMVAVTGSNGKTVVKEWIAELAPSNVKLFRSPKSYNSQIGVPLSILMMDGDEDVAVIEAGISQSGEMERLWEIIRPDIGVFTTLGDAHQENFRSLEEKLTEKIKLFRDASAIIFNSTGNPMTEVELRMTYPEARFIDAAKQKDAYAVFADRASKENAASALSVCDALGFDHEASVARLGELKPVAMRLELKEGVNGSVIVNDSYNSDINSLAIALDYLSAVGAGRKQILILSDILQSSLSQSLLYERVAEMVERSRVSKIVGIGKAISAHAALFGSDAEFYPDTKTYFASMGREDFRNSAVLIKGNRSAHFEDLTHALERKSHTTTLEVDLDAMVHNINVHRSLLAPSTKLMAMVKASGYGHGTYELAGMLKHEGVEYLAVAFADEGVHLRELSVTMPIVVLNADADSFGLMVRNSLEPEIYSLESLTDFLQVVKGNCERAYPIHLKLDTGMHRLGFEEGDLPSLRELLGLNTSFVRVKSIFSHLASSDNPADDDFTRAQIALFGRMSDDICSGLPYKPLRHIANSAAISRFPEAQFDMVRLGIGMYGFGAEGLIPAAALKTRIVQIKELAPPETVGYGRSGHLERPSRVATIPIGYADGLDRHLGNGRWSMDVGGKLAPVVGRICMDTCMIDVTGMDASIGDEVVVFGGSGDTSAENMARVLDTIPYEILTSVSSRVKRVFTKQ